MKADSNACFAPGFSITEMKISTIIGSNLDGIANKFSNTFFTLLYLK